MRKLIVGTLIIGSYFAAVSTLYASSDEIQCKTGLTSNPVQYFSPSTATVKDSRKEETSLTCTSFPQAKAMRPVMLAKNKVCRGCEDWNKNCKIMARQGLPVSTASRNSSFCTGGPVSKGCRNFYLEQCRIGRLVCIKNGWC